MMTVSSLILYSVVIYALVYFLIEFHPENTLLQRSIDIIVVLLLMCLILMVLLTMTVGVTTYA